MTISSRQGGLQKDVHILRLPATTLQRALQSSSVRVIVKVRVGLGGVTVPDLTNPLTSTDGMIVKKATKIRSRGESDANSKNQADPFRFCFLTRANPYVVGITACPRAQACLIFYVELYTRGRMSASQSATCQSRPLGSVVGIALIRNNEQNHQHARMLVCRFPHA